MSSSHARKLESVRSSGAFVAFAVIFGLFCGYCIFITIAYMVAGGSGQSYLVLIFLLGDAIIATQGATFIAYYSKYKSAFTPEINQAYQQFNPVQQH